MTFAAPTDEQRAAWLARIGEAGAHDEIARREAACLHELDVIDGPPVGDDGHRGWMRIAAWNAERGRYLHDSVALLRRVGADVVLASELDSGMARSGNHDVPRRWAEAMGMSGAYGVEFVELGLGDPRELAAMPVGDGARNDRGLHGNAVLVRGVLRDAAVLRLDAGGAWFSHERGQPRVGGRVAVAGRVGLDGVDVTVVSVHLESSSTADERAAQLGLLLDEVDARYSTGPAVVGGDLNTFGAPMAELLDRSTASAMRAADPARFSWPVAYEPLFAVAASHGFGWVDANVAAPTTRHGVEGVPDHVPMHLDWLLVRGLEARRATVVPATAAGSGAALSDHELVAVSVRLIAGA